jgi:hypothetical protein
VSNTREIRRRLRPVWAAIMLVAVTMLAAITLTAVGVARHAAEERRVLCEDANVRDAAIRDAVDKLVPDRSVLEPETRKAFAHLLSTLGPRSC